MKRRNKMPAPRMNRLAGGVAVVLAAWTLSPAPAAAQATDTGGGIKWTFDGEVSQGLTWRAGSRDPRLVGPSQGGLDASDLADDGNLNSNRHTLVSSPTTLLGTVEGESGNHRVLLRGSVMYDSAIMSHWQHWGADANPQGLRDQVRDAVGRRARLMDAYYAYGTPLESGGNLEFKLGRQTILWGESKFLGNGINMFNPIDASKTHKAGVSLKEMILPIGAAEASWQLNSAWTFQGFYQLEKARFEYDPVGTFFSDIDLLGKGAGDSTIVPFAPPLLRGADGRVGRSGQFGVAAFTKAGDWNLGFYYQNLSQRAAKLSGTGLNGATSYFQEWPDSVKTYAMSWARGLGSASVYGELGIRRGVPVGLDNNAVGAARANAALCGAVLHAPANCGVDFAMPPFGIPVPPLAITPLRADADGYVRGWTRTSQSFVNLGLAQAFTGSDVLPSMLGANGGALFLETTVVRTSLPNKAVLPTAVTDRWHGSFFGQLSVDYLRVGGSNIAITPKLIVQTWYLGDDVSQAPFLKGRWAVTPALEIRHEQAPDITFQIAYTSIFDRGSRGNRVLSDRDFLAMQLKWAF